MKRNLMNELTEGLDALAEERNMTRDQLLKDYARIIDKQKKEIKELQGQVDQHKARVDKLSLLLGSCI